MSYGWEELTDTKGNTYYRKRKTRGGTLEVALSPNEDRYIGCFVPYDKTQESFTVTHYPNKPRKPFPPTYDGSFDCRKSAGQEYAKRYVVPTPKALQPRVIGPIPKIPVDTPKKSSGPIPKIRTGPTLVEQAIAYGKSNKPLLVANSESLYFRKKKDKLE